MRNTLLNLALACAAFVAVVPVRAAGPQKDGAMIERGRYLVRTSGCNDCHTSGYAERAGMVAEKDWLKGDHVGWRGPWGTTYPSNLRNYMASMTEEQWLATAGVVRQRPPMPWFALRDMKKEDLQAIYRYVRYLGPAGEAAPAYLPPGVEPKGPAVLFPAPPPAK